MNKVAYVSLVGVVIAEEREIRGISQIAAANVSGLNQSTWARIESGKAITIENILKVSKVLNFEPWQLFKVVDDRVKALVNQGVEVVFISPNDEDFKNDPMLITSKEVLKNTSLLGLAGVGGIIALGVTEYISRLVKK